MAFLKSKECTVIFQIISILLGEGAYVDVTIFKYNCWVILHLILLFLCKSVVPYNKLAVWYTNSMSKYDNLGGISKLDDKSDQIGEVSIIRSNSSAI